MPTDSGWPVRRSIVIVGVVTLLAVVAVMVWDRPSPDSGPGSDAPAVSAGVDGDPMVAPPEAVLFGGVLSIFDATVRNRVWYLLDLDGPQVHRVDPATGAVRSFGRRGEGPGEFRGLPGNIVAHGDSIVVTDGRSLRVFGLEGQHYGDRDIRFNPACSIEDALSLSDALVFLVRCSSLGEITFHALLETHDATLTEVASLLQAEGDIIEGKVVMGPHPNGFLFGRPYDDCLELFGHDGAALGAECHEWIERLPIPGMTEDERAEIQAAREYGRQHGIEIELPDHLPPFLQIFMTGAGELVYKGNAPDGRIARLLRRSARGQQVVVPVRSAPVMIVDGDPLCQRARDTRGERD